MAATTDSDEQGPAARNDVLLVGRVAAAPQERELPSGDLLVTLRLVVDRPVPPRPAPGRAVTVDALDCACWTAGVRRTARGLQAGDVVEVQGALRRRFWRSGAGAASRTEVEVTGLRRLARAAGPAERRPGRPTASDVTASGAEPAAASVTAGRAAAGRPAPVRAPQAGAAAGRPAAPGDGAPADGAAGRAGAAAGRVAAVRAAAGRPRRSVGTSPPQRPGEPPSTEHDAPQAGARRD